MVATANEDTVFLGYAVLGIKVRPRGVVGNLPETVGNCDMALAIEGGALNVARAYQQAGGIPSLMGLVAGADVPEYLLDDIGVRAILQPRRMATARFAHRSRVIPNGRRSGAPTMTFHQPIDTADLAHVEPWLSSSRRLVLASMTAQQAPLVRRLIEVRPREVCLLLTHSQCQDRKTTFEMARLFELVQLNADELEVWTGIRGDVASGINCLRDRGVNQVIVRDGKRGITAFVAGEWHHQPAFRVEKRMSDSQCGDVTFGTYLAARHQGHSIRDSLKFAAAAAAMHVARAERHQRGLNELIAFSKTTPTQRYALEDDGKRLEFVDEASFNVTYPF